MTLTAHMMGAVEKAVPRIREVLPQNKMGCCMAKLWASTPGASQAKGKSSGKTVRY